MHTFFHQSMPHIFLAAAWKIKMLPLSFVEFLDFHGFKIEETANVFGGNRKIIKDQNGIIYEPAEAFDAYLLFGGMPGIADIGP